MKGHLPTVQLLKTFTLFGYFTYVQFIIWEVLLAIAL